MKRSSLPGILTVIVILAVILLGWFGAISPQLQQVSDAQAQIASANAQNQVLAQTLVTLKKESDSLPKLTAQLDKLRVQIPQTADVETFLAEMQALAAANGVSLTVVTVPEATAYPSATVAAPTATAPAAGAAVPTPAPTPTPVPTALTTPTTTIGAATDLQPSAALASNLYTIHLSVSVSGPGPGIIAFVQALQKGDRIFLVTSVNINTQAPDALGTAAITGYLFIVTSPAEIAARAGTANSKPTPTPSATPTPTPTPTAGSTPTATPTPTGSPTPSATPTPQG